MQNRQCPGQAVLFAGSAGQASLAGNAFSRDAVSQQRLMQATEVCAMGIVDSTAPNITGGD